MTNNMATISLEDFKARFAAEAKRIAGFEVFDDGTTVDEYCEMISESYYSDPFYRDDGPEACAESDVSYWGEE